MRLSGTRRTMRIGGAMMLLGLALSVLFSLSCEGEGAPIPAELASFLARGSDAAFVGERQYENHYGSEAHALVERAARDEQGALYAELVSSDGLDVKAYIDQFGESAWSTAKAKYNLFAWYSAALRDFRVHDAELFVKNYRLLETPKPGQWIGRETVELLLGRVGGDRLYALSADKASGFPLRIEERSREGAALSTLAYLSVRFEGIAAGGEGMPPAIKRPKEASLGAQPAWASEYKNFGFTPFVPQALPEGFRRANAKLLTAIDGSRSLLDLFTDGVETIAVRERNQPYSIVFSSEELAAVKAQPSSPARRFAYGPVTVIESYVGDLLISVVGKLGPDEALVFAESFAPAK